MTFRSTVFRFHAFGVALLSLLFAPAVFCGQMGGTKPVLQATPVQQAAPAAAAVPNANVMQAGSVVSASTYIIGPGDLLQLTVWKEPGMSNASVPVRPDGMISLSLVGDVPAAGVTPMQLGTDIAGRLKKYVNDPLVTVTVLGVQTKEIYLLGEIGKTGPIGLTPGMTPLQAIASAGGLSPYAKKSSIYILRKVSGRNRKIPFDYKKAIKDGDLQGVTLLPGDTIVVP